MENKIKDSKKNPTSASKNCLDIDSKYKKYKRQNQKRFPPVRYEKPPHY